MKLYYYPLSGNSRRVLLVAAHLDIPLERIAIDLPSGEQRSEAHLARNPNGRVPVLDDHGFLLWESRAIMMYLAEQTPGQTLLPDDPRGRADVARWLFWCAHHMSVACSVIVFENFVKAASGRGEPDPVELARGEALFAQHAKVLDDHLAKRTWIAQDRVTLADFSLASGFALAGPARMPLERYSHLRAWLGRVQELPAWQRTAPQR